MKSESERLNSMELSSHMFCTVGMFPGWEWSGIDKERLSGGIIMIFTAGGLLYKPMYK